MAALAHRVRPARGEPEGALVLLHGRGTDEHDLFGLFDELDPDRRLIGITPRAPLSLPPGGQHWYAFRAVGFPDPGASPTASTSSMRSWPICPPSCASPPTASSWGASRRARS